MKKSFSVIEYFDSFVDDFSFFFFFFFFFDLLE